MRWFVFSMCLLSLVCAAPSAWGHGFSLSLSGNTLNASSNDYPGNGNPFLFGEGFEDVGGDLASDHGGAGSSLFGTGKTLSFEVLGPLWYSNGGAAAEARDGLSLLMEGSGGSIEIDRDTNYLDGFAISGNTSHEFLFTLLAEAALPFSAADNGVYGIMYRVKGSPTGGSPYQPTPWLVSTWMTPGFNPGTDPLSPTSPLRMAQNAIFSAATAVPEPTTLASSLCGVLVASAFGWCRHARRRGC
jgi:hypothetical protein